MKIGEVICKKENEFYVITHIENEQVIGTERLEEFIARNIILHYNGEPKTIKEIIEFHCNMYLNNHSIIVD